MFKKYVKEVLAIAKKQNIDIDTATNKFIADVRAGESLDYNTNGDAKVNFSLLKIVFDVLSKEEQSIAIDELKEAVHEKVFPKEEE